MTHALERTAAQAVETITVPDAGNTPDRQGMDLLAAHVPLSLLLDLARGPESERLLEAEAPSAEELAWLAPAG